jgi:hypothetical protein
MATARPLTDTGRPLTGDAARPERSTLLQFTCASTGQRIEHQVPSDAGTVRDMWTRKLALTCPHCGEVHQFSFRTAFIEGALARGAFEPVAARDRAAHRRDPRGASTP